MFEGVVATLLNRYLGKYIQDLDTEDLNVGIFSGDVQLSELKLKPEALYELDLPIEVKVGTIGRITIRIPWGGLYSQNVSVDMEDVYVIAGPITDRDYDPEKEKRLMRAAKRNKLEFLESENFLGTDAPDSHSFFENLATTIMNNLQVHIHNVHIRYEDSTMNQGNPFACGICIQGISVETTNSKWKPTTSYQGASSVYQMVKVESLSIYVNPTVRSLIGSSPGLATSAPHTWRNDMKRGLETFSVNNDEFDFILKPIAAKMKVIVNKSNEARVPKLLVDCVLQDAATQLSRQQYLALIQLCESFQYINTNRKYRQFYPGIRVPGNASKWWQYTYKAVLEQRIYPFTWQRMAKHRMNYHKYREVYAQSLLNPTDTELKLDLQQHEDQLDMLNIVIAREHAKIQLHQSNPERVNVCERAGEWWRTGLEGEVRSELRVMADKGRGIWAQLSATEKAKLYDAIGYVEEAPCRPEKPKQYIEHKVNFTLANCNLSLVNRGREILVLTLAQFLGSIETRPSARAFKVSARVESFVVEGASLEHDLVPIITADNIITGNSASNFLAVDFEKNPLASEADYGLSISLESVEAVYHEHALSELISFLQAPSVSLRSAAWSTVHFTCDRVQSITRRAIARHKAIQLNLDLKLPYLVIPELGSIQKGGNMAVVDLGRIKVTSELQPTNINLEDATQMELEERLYDRFHIDYSDLQVMFCDSGEEWRDAKKQLDSEYHLLPKLQCQVVFSNSVRPEYRQLPRHKLNVSISSLKLNLSDRKIGCVLDFIDNLPLPTANTVHVSVSSATLLIDSQEILGDPQFPALKLAEVKAVLVAAEMMRKNRPTPTANKAAAKMAMLEVDKSFISSEHSDEEMELWARTVDLPGFDDNVSPNNAITMLLRFVIGEVVIQLCRSSNRIDKPYLMLRVTKLVCDTALMEYGPAIQASLGGVQLVDKLHVGLAGEYLELVATEPGTDVISLLYRKVRANCPDFKSHFHSVEQSLVVDFSSISVILHREAFVTLNKYLQYLMQKVQSRDIDLWSRAVACVAPLRKKNQWRIPTDPPIPPGATKFSYSTRLAQFRVRLCDTDMEFLEFKIGGLESDCMFKANERMVLRFYLSSITIDDLSELTLYPKVIAVDEERVIDLKYVRHSPRLYKHTDVDTKRDDVKSDGSLKLHFGRIHIVIFYKMFVDLLHFMEPFIRPMRVAALLHLSQRWLTEQVALLRGWGTRLHLSLDIQAPSLLLPQKLASPNLIIFNLGDLSVENFFKEVSGSGLDSSVPVIDNILVRLQSVQICRAVMTLAGSIHVQEPIVEPVSVRLDVKRTVAYHTAVSALSGMYLPTSAQLLLCRVAGVVDNIRINLGQRDLATLFSVWTDNFNEGRFIGDVTGSWHFSSPLDAASPMAAAEDPAVRKLAAFFSHGEQVRKEASVSLTFDGIQLYLFRDMDEILSSPVRDMNHGLCKVETGEASLTLDTFTDHSLELKMALQSCCLTDIRLENTSHIKKIFQSHGGDMQMESNCHVSVSTPPIVDITFRQSHTGDRCVDILVERTRLNLSIPFLLELGRFVMDALPGDRSCDGGVINHGYVGDTGVQGKAPMEHPRPPSSADSTSGYFSSGASCVDDQAGLSVSLQLRRPEVMLFAGGGASSEDGKSSQALLMRTEFLVDYSRHPGHDNLVCSLSGLHIISNNRKPHLVLEPCDLEFSKTFKSEEGLKMVISVSTIEIRLSPSIVHTLLDVAEEINLNLQTEEPDPLTNVCHLGSDLEDLWSPKKIAPQVYPPHAGQAVFSSQCACRLGESLTLCMTKLCLVLQLEPTVAVSKVPVVMIRAAAEASLHDWSSSAHMQGEVQLQVSYFNSNVGTWEPLIEPVVEVENVYRPWEILFKMFQAKAYPLSSRLDHETVEGERPPHKSSSRAVGDRNIGEQDSETSADEQEPEAAAMTFIRRRETEAHSKNMHESVSMVGYPADSDSENEEGIMEKLACAIGHLFTGDSSDGEASESEESSGAEPSGETEDASELESMSVPGTVVGRDERAVFLKKHRDSVDSGLEAESVDRLATFVMIESRDRLELTVTPIALRVITDLVTAFTRQGPPSLTTSSLSLVNDLAPNSTATLLSQTEATSGQVVMTATYARSDSLPSSPASTTATADLFDEHTPSESDNDIESFEGGFSVYSNAEHKGDISPLMRFPTESVARLYNKVTDQRLRIDIPGFENLEVLCPRHTVNKLHLLHPTELNKTAVRYHLVTNLRSSEYGRSITVRSPLQVRNETSYAMGIYYKKPVLEALGIDPIGESTNPFEDTNRIAVVEPDETYNVPLHVAYHCKLYVLPAYVDSYHVSESGLWWQDLAADLNSPKDIFCIPKEEKDQTVFSVRALCEEGVVTSRASRSIPNYLIRLLPPLAVHNRLPAAVELKIPSIKYDVRIEAGEKANIYFLNLLKMHKIVVEVPAYLGIPWMGSFSLSPDLEEKIVAMATEHDTEGGNKQLGLSIRVERSETCDVLLHAPYWIINKTGLPLQIRASLSDVVYEAQSEEPLLFCYRKLRRRCVRLRAYHSSWSSAFSLDTVGCSGLVVCRDRERKRRYRILLTVSLSRSSPHLTRIVTLLPNFLVTNECRRPLRFMEDNERADLWIDLAPSQCVPFWPDTDSMRMFVKFRDSKLVSQHFSIANLHQTVLRMDRGSGLCVEVSGGGECPFHIIFRPYQPGDAPVRVDNLCEDLFLKIHQQQLGQVALLSPYQSMLYTWDDPSKERCLLWNVYNKKCKGFMANFTKDGYGQERVSFHMVRQQPSVPPTPTTTTVTAKLSASLKRLSTPPQDDSSSSDDSESDELTRPQMMKKTRKDKVVVFWVSYLEGQQRVLLFTQDERVAYHARGKIDAEKSNYEIFLSMRGIGMSLVNNNSNMPAKELAYLSANDSAAIWEVNVAHKWKMLTLELASWIEERWKLDCKKAQMKEYVHVDFEKMHMTKPFYGELRRRYSPALWVQFRKSYHHTYVHLKLHRLQLDNQMVDAVFPTVLNPTPVSPHVVRKVGVKPCIEFAVMKRHRPSHNQDVFKFIRVLVQEFALRLEKGFVLSLYDMLSPWLSEEKPAVRIRKDITTLHQPVTTRQPGRSARAARVVVEALHISPLKLQLSLSPRGSSTTVRYCSTSSCVTGRSYSADTLHLLLDNIAPTLCDTKDIKLKTAFYETRGRVVSLQSEVSEVFRHYSSQLFQQLHVLVLGIDVLSNPYALVSDFTEGLGDLFYEPPLGMLESPEEYGEGLAQAAQSMMGHCVGGLIGANSLITAALPHTINFDDDFKKKRHLCLQLSSEFPESLVASSHTFEMGVALGLSGIIMKPSIDGNMFTRFSQGSQQEGVEGFFRGVGKGLMGLLTKPSGGVTDCIAMACDGIKRASEMGEDIIFRTRLPRYSNPYMGIKPFSVYEATGQQLLNSLSKGHYADTDVYWAHAALNPECKSTLLITLQHVFLVEKCRVWGVWEIDWMVRVDDIMAVPTQQGDKLIFKVRQDERFNLFSGDERCICSEDTAVLQWLRSKVETVLILNMEDKPCPSASAAPV